MKRQSQQGAFNKQYTVMIDTVPLPERSAARVELATRSITPVINEIISDAMTVAIGTWPTPNKPTISQQMANHILEDRRGADYYQDPQQLAAYLQNSLNLTDRQAIQLAEDINQDRNGANYYANQEILQQFLEAEAQMAAQQQGAFNKQYSVMIDTVPLPEKPDERIALVTRNISPVINQIISDAMIVAIGTWPTPENTQQRARQ